MHAVAELDQEGNAEPELLEKLAAQTGLRLFGVLQPAAGQTPLASLVGAARVVLREQETVLAHDHTANAIGRFHLDQ
jgi:hypothetical protein